MKSLEVIILGCGTSGGVPRIGNDWGACDPAEPKNRRRRCSILVRRGQSSVLIDTSPDLREQLLDADVSHLDGVVWTHDHADQCHGIDDLRPLALRLQRPIEAWTDTATLRTLESRFRYCFHAPSGSLYPPIVSARDHGEKPFQVAGIGFTPMRQIHGRIISYGFRFGDIAYSNDVAEFEDGVLERLAGLKVWIVDAMRYKPHPTHAHLERTLSWIAKIRPERAILTNMHVDLDYESLRRELPPGVEPAYDGMVIRA